MHVARRPGPVRRALDGRVVGGVAAGVSRKLGVDPAVARAAFVLSTITGGLGVAAYVLAWLFLPLEGEEHGAAARAVGDRRGVALVLGLVPLLALALVVASLVGAAWLATISWPTFVAAGGLVLVWRNVSPAERALLGERAASLGILGRTTRRSRRVLALRSLAGAALVVLGLDLLTTGRRFAGVGRPIVGLAAFLAGATVAFGPWWLRIVRDLVAERQARVRAEERADMAARVHDSVLQTLALIQRRADVPHEVVTLARSQERELRSWLFEGRVPGRGADEDASMSGAVQRIQREVEELHGVPVEAVVVGDCALDAELRSLLAAGREATVNAAKWSGAPVVSLFVEVEQGRVEMYVRDRGAGFDETAVAPDRRGISDSIRGRMERHGGNATVRTSPGKGTEVTLTMARR
ncbi:MAG: PspC domain-containing protein [Actinomycetota bacterium]|nr:PspC domain-containing protein [Actinomycetota bacterium]